MRQIVNLTGTIMYEDTEVINFKIVRGEVKQVDIVGDKLPFEFRYTNKQKALLMYLDEVVVPESRIGLSEYLAEAGIPYFDMDMILKRFHGYTINSPHHWLRFDEGPQTWEQMKNVLLSAPGGECLRGFLEQ